MKKRLVCLTLALVTTLALALPAFAEEKAAPPSRNFSQYLTGEPLKKEELTLGGRPFYEVSLKEVPSIFPVLEYQNSYTYTEKYEDKEAEMDCYGTWSQTGEDTVHTNMSARQRVGDTTLVSASYMARKSKAGNISELKTEIRGITTKDTLESVLEALGVSAEGAPLIAAEMTDNHTNFNLNTGRTFESSYINSYDVNGEGFDAPAIRWEDNEGRIKAAFFFYDGLLGDVILSNWEKDVSQAWTPAPTFTDVPEGEYYAAAVAWAVRREITNGTSDTAFSPDDECTEGEILTFLWRAAGEPEEGVKTPIANVKEDDFFYGAAQWANDMGMIDPGTFAPAKPCTRAQAVKFIWMAFAQAMEGKKSAFTDVPDDADYVDAVVWAVENGVTNGTTDTTFGPADTCTRGQIVTFLHRAYVPEVRLNTK